MSGPVLAPDAIGVRVPVGKGFLSTRFHQGQERRVGPTQTGKGGDAVLVSCVCGWRDPVRYKPTDAARHYALRSHLVNVEYHSTAWEEVQETPDA